MNRVFKSLVLSVGLAVPCVSVLAAAEPGALRIPKVSLKNYTGTYSSKLAENPNLRGTTLNTVTIRDPKGQVVYTETRWKDRPNFDDPTRLNRNRPMDIGQAEAAHKAYDEVPIQGMGELLSDYRPRLIPTTKSRQDAIKKGAETAFSSLGIDGDDTKTVEYKSILSDGTSSEAKGKIYSKKSADGHNTTEFPEGEEAY